MFKRNCFLSVLVICVFTGQVKGQSGQKIAEDVNWKSFLSHHDLVWERTPDDYFSAPFFGNGLLGAIVYQPAGSPLRMDIGRIDVVDHRNTEARSIVDNGRLPVGHFTFETNGDMINLAGRLSLFDAEVIFTANITEPILSKQEMKKMMETDSGLIHRLHGSYMI